jgi:2-oxoisovalerate dehydrogenase E2 component (dihydrolipoyl transacylase)
VPELKEFKLPDIGEGLTEADILTWSVAVGDTVTVNQILVEIETAKAAVELPSPFAGVVTSLHVAEGDTVYVGRAIITIDTDPNGPGSGVIPSPTAGMTPQPVADEPSMAEGRQPMLVGYGPKADGAARRRPRLGSEKVAMDPVDSPTERRPAVLAKPPVRKLAKSLGVDLADVAATGPNGTVSRADVESAALPSSAPVARSAAPSGARETRIPIKGVRKHTAAAMVGSAFTAPHVTVFMTVDVSPMMELRERIAARREFRGVKVSPLLILAKAVILAVAKTPELNASWDEAANEIVLKHYVNLGIAAATDRGLIVPNIKDADQLSLLELARAIGELTDTARSGKTSPAQMSGGSITITNIGVFGVDTGTPILNPGESGIVAFGAIRRMPWVVDEQVVPRWVTQIAASFDHRIVDGQQGSTFVADVAGVLADPGLALL